MSVATAQPATATRGRLPVRARDRRPALCCPDDRRSSLHADREDVLSPMLVGALCALLFLVAGGLAYAGRGRSIVLKGFPTPALFFGLAWLGAGGLVVIVSSQLSQAGHPVAGTLLALPGVVGCPRVPAQLCLDASTAAAAVVPRLVRPGPQLRGVPAPRSAGATTPERALTEHVEQMRATFGARLARSAVSLLRHVFSGRGR